MKELNLDSKLCWNLNLLNHHHYHHHRHKHYQNQSLNLLNQHLNAVETKVRYFQL